MPHLPNYRPKQMSLGPLETEILNIIWALEEAVSVKDIHDKILSDPDRELAYASVTTILHRLAQKGWVTYEKKGKVFYWQALISKAQAQSITAYDQLHKFLEITNPDVVASFADSVDITSVERLKAIAARLEAIRSQRQKGE